MSEFKCSEWDICEAMRKYGGSFVKQLAELYLLGDHENRKILRSAFRAYFNRYDEIASGEGSEGRR